MATYATWNPDDKNSYITLSENNLKATNSATGWHSVRAGQGKSSGKWYFEVTVTAGSTYWTIGCGTADASLDRLGNDAYGWGYEAWVGKLMHGGTESSYGDTYGLNDVIGVALDLDNGEVYFSKNGVWQNSSDPVERTNPAATGLTGIIYPMVCAYSNGNALTANFGASAFAYSAPSGYNSGWYEDSGGADTDTLIQAQPLRQYGISGPVTATDNEVPVFDGTTGKKVKSGGGLIISENLMQAENKALLLEGATGDTPTSGAGTRMMWIPAKGAFRAGHVIGAEWDDGNIGGYSQALGYRNTASAYYSTAIGREVTASGQNATALGTIATANSISSTAIGLYAKSSNSYAMAIGNMFGMGNVEASGLASLAIGVGCGSPHFMQNIKASGSGSLIIATTTTMITAEASGEGSVLIGSCRGGSSSAAGKNSMVLAAGGNINASAENAIAVGRDCVNATAESMRIGWSANNGIHVKGQELWFGDTDNLFSLDVGTTNGLQIGKSASQKLGFFGATPVTQRLKADYNNWASLSDVVGALVSLGLFDQV